MREKLKIDSQKRTRKPVPCLSRVYRKELIELLNKQQLKKRMEILL